MGLLFELRLLHSRTRKVHLHGVDAYPLHAPVPTASARRAVFDAVPSCTRTCGSLASVRRHGRKVARERRASEKAKSKEQHGAAHLGRLAGVEHHRVSAVHHPRPRAKCSGLMLELARSVSFPSRFVVRAPLKEALKKATKKSHSLCVQAACRGTRAAQLGAESSPASGESVRSRGHGRHDGGRFRGRGRDGRR